MSLTHNKCTQLFIHTISGSFTHKLEKRPHKSQGFNANIKVVIIATKRRLLCSILKTFLRLKLLQQLIHIQPLEFSPILSKAFFAVAFTFYFLQNQNNSKLVGLAVTEIPTLSNVILCIARNLLETRENIKNESHPFYSIICD